MKTIRLLMGITLLGTSCLCGSCTEDEEYTQGVWQRKSDSDDDFTPFEGTARSQAVAFSTGTRGFVLTGASSGYFFDDVWALLPYQLEDVD